MGGSEPGRGQLSSDRRLSKVPVIKERRALQFHIPIPPQPPRYRPGSGPPPCRINLRLVHDSNAFIVDKVILPRGPFSANDTRQRRCYYIVGWPDLPAARPVVDAAKILDYVSPRTLEDWEYNDALSREEEKEKAKAAEERAKAKGKAVLLPADDYGLVPDGKRRPGRLHEEVMSAQMPSDPELTSEQEDLLQRRMDGPSLSTPQKSRLAQLVAEEEMLEKLEEVDDNAGSTLYQQAETGTLFQDGLGVHANPMDSEDLGWGQSSAAATAWSGGESSRASSARPNQGMDPPSSLARTAASAAKHEPSLPTLVIQARKQQTSSPSPTSPSRPIRASVRRPTSITPIPLPPYVQLQMKQPAPMIEPSANQMAASGGPRALAEGGWGVASTPVQSKPYSNTGPGRSSPWKSPTYRGSGFTPIGGTFPRPPKRPAEESPASSGTPASLKSKKSKKSKQSKRKQTEQTQTAPESAAEPAAEPLAEPATLFDPAVDLVQGEQDYVVKRLEGDYILDGIHWFKVRWEGVWPEGQNPTWEPMENISGKLVKEYLARKARREAEKQARPPERHTSAKKAKSKRPGSLADWARGYNSVAEAFEGQAELNATTEAMLRQGNGSGSDVDGGGGGGGGPDEELFIVDEESERAVRERQRAVDAQIATQLASMARGSSRQF